MANRRQDSAIRFYVGGYAQPEEPGVRKCAFDAQTGACVLEEAFFGLTNPSYLLCHPQKPVLYAVEEKLPEGRVIALSTEGEKLRELCALPSGGADPCHLSFSPDERFLLVSNYTSGSIAVFALDEAGVPVRMSDFVQHRMDAPGVNPVRQECPHVHFTLCDGERVFVCDLGLDAVLVYGWDAENGKLIDRGERLRLPGGAGPRHLAFSEDRRHMYVLCELTAQVCVFAHAGGEGWRCVQTLPLVPENFTGHADFTYSVAAAIRLADAHTLVASIRGHDSIAVFPIAGDGTLGARRSFASEGRTPRDFQLAGGCLIAANQDSGSLTVFRRREGTNEYEMLRREEISGHPNCICLIP